MADKILNPEEIDVLVATSSAPTASPAPSCSPIDQLKARLTVLQKKFSQAKTKKEFQHVQKALTLFLTDATACHYETVFLPLARTHYPAICQSTHDRRAVNLCLLFRLVADFGIIPDMQPYLKKKLFAWADNTRVKSLYTAYKAGQRQRQAIHELVSIAAAFQAEAGFRAGLLQKPKKP